MDFIESKSGTRLRTVVLAALLLFGAAACTGDDDATTGEPEASPTGAETADEPTPGTEEARTRVEIELVDNEYEPSEVTVPAGEVVTFLLENTGENGHTFTVSDLDVDIELQFGQPSRADLTFPEPGEYELRCRFHGDAGMTGTIIAQ